MTDTRLTTAWAERLRLRAEGDKIWAEGAKLRAEVAKLRAESDKLWAEDAKLRVEGDKLRAEGEQLWAEDAKLRAEGDIQWAQAILDVLGNVPMEWHTNGDCTVCGVRYAATPTDPTPTPTPREVLARWSRNWYHKAVSPTSPDAPSAFEAEYHAALAATGDTLREGWWSELSVDQAVCALAENLFDELHAWSSEVPAWDEMEPGDCEPVLDILRSWMGDAHAAYTTLAAQLKAIRENESSYRMENDQFRTKIAELQAKLDAAENTKLATEVMKETLKRIGEGW